MNPRRRRHQRARRRFRKKRDEAIETIKCGVRKGLEMKLELFGWPNMMIPPSAARMQVTDKLPEFVVGGAVDVLAAHAKVNGKTLDLYGQSVFELQRYAIGVDVGFGENETHLVLGSFDGDVAGGVREVPGADAAIEGGDPGIAKRRLPLRK